MSCVCCMLTYGLHLVYVFISDAVQHSTSRLLSMHLLVVVAPRSVHALPEQWLWASVAT